MTGMINLLKYAAPFFVLIMLQVLFLDRIDLGTYIVPHIYILFVLTLPTEMRGWVTLVIGFGLGMVIDIFASTPGMHTSATLLLVFCRKFLLQFMAPREGYEFGTRPTIAHMGFLWFAMYAAILTFVHHFFLFFIELFRLSGYGDMLLRVLASTMFSLVIMLALQFFDPIDKPK